jgi:hypothetical protein
LLRRRTIRAARGAVIRIRTIIRPGTLVFRVVYALAVPRHIPGNVWPGWHVIPAAIKKRKQHSEFVPSTAVMVPVSPDARAVPPRRRHMHSIKSKPRHVGFI